ncbi:hypothetical protein FMUND_4278 [Fusarium mundagurra]|uniref:BTB domain-containing protein n=1 Tax=Fusarium mundagurra TaxID=1567541 RepID=A0A8H5YZM7_9HYPO|nr:hypothetical protein FMUND_4278 [Fusarium mundagurra]
MKSISYDIDPRGDIELILKCPNKQYIIAESRTLPSDPQDPQLLNSPCLGRYEVFSELYTDEEEDEDEDEDNQNETLEEVEVRMRVSSRHLTLASRTFRAMLEGPWKEGNSSFRPIRQISTEDWDVFALAIVMDSIHGRHHGIPTQITGGLLTRIATIVDYYQCREAMHFNYEVWTHGVIAPSELCTVALLWLYVSWVFHDVSRCRTLACLFVRFGIGACDFDTHDLPVGGVLDLLDGIRRNLINRVLVAIGSLHETLITEEGCESENDSDCTAIMLGVLVKEMRDMACLDPPLDASFDGRSLDEMVSMVDKFRIPMSPHKLDEFPFEEEEDGSYHPCTIQGRLDPVIKEIKEAIEGVSLADLQP